MENQNLCMHCHEAITDPICTDCYLRQINQFLAELDIRSDLRKIVIYKIKEQISEESLNEAMCIICNKETLTICPYCFFYKAARVLKKMNLDKEVLENFLEIFNYRLGHEEYSL